MSRFLNLVCRRAVVVGVILFLITAAGIATLVIRGDNIASPMPFWVGVMSMLAMNICPIYAVFDMIRRTPDCL